MLTVAYFRNELNNLRISMTDGDLKNNLRNGSKQVSENITDLQIIGGTSVEFKLNNFPVLDNSLTAYRSNSNQNLAAAANIQTMELYDFEVPFVQVAQVAIDAALGYVRLLVPYDLTVAPQDFLLFRYSFVDYEPTITRLVFTSSLGDRITSEKRGNVTINKRSLIDALAQQKALAASDGADLQEVMMTRLSAGRVYGANPLTGEVLP